MERRLAAILAADVVGYSRLMEQDEAATLAALRDRRKSILTPLVALHKGRVVKLMGDGVLVEFASAVNAVQCAVELQQKMAEANVGVEDERTVVLRVGINLGDVAVETGDIYGDGVNIAARLEGIAEPGTVYISGTVYDQVKGKLKLDYEELGPQRMKNIAEPVRTYRIVSAPAPAKSAKRAATDKPSIAVLPFTNMSGDPEQQYFSDGVTEDIITELSRCRDLLVIARNSSFQYRDKARDLRRVGRELGADYIVEGSVRKTGGRIRVTAQLVETVEGNHIWAERYDCDLQDIFSVQDEVVATIVSTIIGRVGAGDAQRARRKPPELWAAYDYFLQGREAMWRFDAAAGVLLLRRAIELDPNFAPSYVWLSGCCYIVYGDHGREEDLQEGLQAAQKAVALDPENSGSHRAIALIYAVMREYDLAGAHFDRALALNPNDVLASTLRNLWLAYIGRGEEAVRGMQADIRRDPFPPTWYWECLGIALFQTRRYEETIAAFKRMDLLHWWSHCYLAASHAHLGQLEAARKEAGEVLRLKPDFKMQEIERPEYWRDPADLANLTDGLRKAALPE